MGELPRRKLLSNFAAYGSILIGGVALGSKIQEQRDRNVFISELEQANDANYKFRRDMINAAVDDEFELDEKDKEAAIEQMGGQVADNTSNVLTAGFSHLARKYPWLYESRKNVGLLCLDNEPIGSAVLIDAHGTIALCAHEFLEQGSYTIVFFPEEKTGSQFELRGQLLYDNQHDLMFGSIDSSVLAEVGLIPIKWGQMGYYEHSPESELVAVGFPGQSKRLHATSGHAMGFDPLVTYSDNTQGSCKIHSSIIGFGGMSGGGIFRDGKFVGIMNAATPLGAHTSAEYTPADLILRAYAELFPDRAMQAKLPNPLQASDSELPKSCDIERRSFLSAFLPHPM